MLNKFLNLMIITILSTTLYSADGDVLGICPGKIATSHDIDMLVKARRPGMTLGFESPILSFKIAYSSTMIDGKTTKATGLVLIPIFNNKKVISYQHGTIMADKQAPSVDINNLHTKTELTDNVVDGLVLASQGYNVIIPDYYGYVLSKEHVHPYFDRASEISACRNMLIAVKKVHCFKDILGKKLYLAGYSEGGHATMSLLKSIEEKAITGYTLMKSCVGSAPHDPMTTFMGGIYYNLPGGNRFYALAMTAFNDNYGWNRPYTSFFNEPYASLFPQLVSGKFTNEEVTAQLPATPGEMFAPQFIYGFLTQQDLPVLGAIANAVTLNDKPTTKFMLFASSNDATVPSLYNTMNFWNTYTAGGTINTDKVTLDVRALGDHTDPVTLGAWLQSILEYVQIPVNNG